jgi:NAD(P)-dependent dehydrogenase (short-subunit alcohol dehydrogenase family)
MLPAVGSTNRVAIVTGGASGIGLAIAERLAADGHAVAVLDRNAEAAVEAGERLGGLGLGVDVTDRPGIDAGVKVDLETWNRVLEVNLTGTFHCCQAVVPHMVEAGWGRIVTISSSSAQGGQQLMSPYVASKAGVIGLTKSLALELGPKGITVNTIPPSFIDTPMLRASEEKGYLGPGVEAAVAGTPVRRIGTPEDIAAMTSFLVRDEAGYVTGQVLGVNGGRNT